MRSPIQEIRRNCELEELDYVFLSTVLQKWASPRNIISRLIRSGDIIRVKKGIYVFGPDYAKRPFSPEILANKIYGPSYVSAEYALSFWGLIPEGVIEVTSMTTGKSKRFSTPVGRFSYHHIDPVKFFVGVVYRKFSEKHGALMATPEKALVDLLINRKENACTPVELKKILYEDLRIDPQGFKHLHTSMMKDILQSNQNMMVETLIQLLREERKHA